MKAGVWLDQAHVALLGSDVVSAMLLSQIAYWYRPGKDGNSKLRVLRGGSRWLAKSAADWHLELGLTPKQAYRGINVLESKGLIETKVMRFAGSPTKHVRLTAAGHKVLNGAVGEFDSTSKENPSSPAGKSFTDSTAETTAGIDPAGKPATGTHPQDIGKSNEEEKAKEKVEGEKNFEEGLPNNVTNLAQIWRERMKAKYPGFQKELTKKERGQLKQFRNKVGQRAMKALAYALAEWGRVVWSAKGDKGLSAVPSQPHIGFLLAHHDVVIGMIEQEEKQKVQQKLGQQVQFKNVLQATMPTANGAAVPLEPNHVPTEEQKALLDHLVQVAKAAQSW